MQVKKRNGQLVPFQSEKIVIALRKAFDRLEPGTDDTVVEALASKVASEIAHLNPDVISIEEIQDRVETTLMHSDYPLVAKGYILYRQSRAVARTERAVRLSDGTELKRNHLSDYIFAVAGELLSADQATLVLDRVFMELFDGATWKHIEDGLVMAATALVEKDSKFLWVASRFLLHALRVEVLGKENARQPKKHYYKYLPEMIEAGIAAGRYSPMLGDGRFDLKALAAALVPDRDLKFNYLGLKTLYDRYLVHVNGSRIETPQHFLMRVAMGLSLKEADPTAAAIQFYEVLSTHRILNSTPTLFNSGCTHPQLSSCFLTTVDDNIQAIFNTYRDNGLMSKYAGGIGNDWTNVRGLGAHIKGTNGKSQGLVPWFKLDNDVAVAVNQCFAGSTAVYTSDGVKPIRHVTTDDMVLTADGAYSPVREVLEYSQKGQPMVRVTVKHGLEPLDVTSGHPLWVADFGDTDESQKRRLTRLEKGKIRIDYKEAGDLALSDWVGKVIPTEVVKVDGFSEDWAFFYGLVLGDGTLGKYEGSLVFGKAGKSDLKDWVLKHLSNHDISHKLYDNETVWTVKFYGLGGGVTNSKVTGRLENAGLPNPMPFDHQDVYTATGRKRISPRLMHLPPNQTAALVCGLVRTDGHLHQGKNITFYSSSPHLAYGMQYQVLRLRAPVSGAKTIVSNEHLRSRGCLKDTSIQFVLRIPAISVLSTRLGIPVVTKHNWIEHDGIIYSRIEKIEKVDHEVVYDLKVDGNPSYMTQAVLAHNGGKRKGAICSYLETWHIDIEEFLELRKDTGDERRRTHDMNTANWVPDLFMERVRDNAEWTLFSPNQVPDLHDLYGLEFKEAYHKYEEKAEQGLIQYKKIPAVTLWRKMLTMLFETGHPWITFKDAFNLRNPQRHDGVIHSSNLCTEISLNTKSSAYDVYGDRTEVGEVAVCNLASVNLVEHFTLDAETGKPSLDLNKLKDTVTQGVRMLDNVIDLTFYPVPEGRQANQKHRPIGLGLMGFQDALYIQGISYESEAAVAFASYSTEAISYYAINASHELANERGSYASFEGSDWSRGLLPMDTLSVLAHARDQHESDLGYPDSPGARPSHFDWDSMRSKVSKGMRNSNTLAIAPTATIASILNVYSGIDPAFENVFVKSTMSGDFVIVNEYLLETLKALGMWNDGMQAYLKRTDGSIQDHPSIPQSVKNVYKTAYEIDPVWLVRCGAARQVWIDQAQSLNLYMRGVSGQKLHDLYMTAWKLGLKSTYYLRTQSASKAEKSTGDGSDLRGVSAEPVEEKEPAFCALRPGDAGFEDCEACT